VSGPDAPLLLVRGSATREELAAVVALLAARGGEPEPAPAPPPPSAWRRSAGLRRPVVPGPGAWRRSGLPGL
jgi:hypothetical protein